MPATTPDEPDIVSFLCESHRAIDRTLDELLGAVLADDPREIAAHWARLDSDLRAHMEAEERFVLPAFARVELAEATALLREHHTLRQQLLELGVAAELHCLRAERCQKLVHDLRAHAHREDQLLYRWAAARLAPTTAAAVRHHIDAARAASASAAVAA